MPYVEKTKYKHLLKIIILIVIGLAVFFFIYSSKERKMDIEQPGVPAQSPVK
ncbi:MAG: hypothetical protein ABIR81_05565 [Ginsengibacter sp.]